MNQHLVNTTITIHLYHDSSLCKKSQNRLKRAGKKQNNIPHLMQVRNVCVTCVNCPFNGKTYISIKLAKIKTRHGALPLTNSVLLMCSSLGDAVVFSSSHSLTPIPTAASDKMPAEVGVILPEIQLPPEPDRKQLEGDWKITGLFP